LLDVHLGREHGLDLLPELRQLEPPAAAIVLSGTSEVDAETRARVDGVLPKPFELGALSAEVGRFAGGATSVRDADGYEERLARYVFDRSEEARAVRVGEKETSEQAAIVARYRDLFTLEQLRTLRAEEHGADGLERERVYRLRKSCEAGLLAAELAERQDALENAILASRIEWRGEELPLRAAQARLAVLHEDRGRAEL